MGEAEIQRAAHEIDTVAYYLELNRFFSKKKIPINCRAAEIKFKDLISKAQINGHDIYIEDFNYSLFEISAKIAISGEMPISIPILNSLNNGKIVITASVGANSPYQLS